MSEYIERELIISSLELAKESNEPCAVRILDLVISLCKHIPAADVAPVRHGKWEWVITGQEEWDFHFQCSECEWFEPARTKYCPNCGADMREES